MIAVGGRAGRVDRMRSQKHVGGQVLYLESGTKAARLWDVNTMDRLSTSASSGIIICSAAHTRLTQSSYEALDRL